MLLTEALLWLSADAREDDFYLPRVKNVQIYLSQCFARTFDKAVFVFSIEYAKPIPTFV
jgi:hypothetical protein